jgi:hypothetical protein
MNVAKRLLNDRQAENRKNFQEDSTQKPAPAPTYTFAGYNGSNGAFVNVVGTGEVLTAKLSTNGYLKPGQPVLVNQSIDGLEIEAMPSVQPKERSQQSIVTLYGKIKILYFINNVATGFTEVFIGGDRKIPKKIAQFPLTSDIKGLVHNLGKQDKYVVSLRVGQDVYSYHGAEKFKNAVGDRDKLKRARFNAVGHGFFTELCEPFIPPVTIANSAFPAAMFNSIDQHFPEVCQGSNCTSSANDNQASGTGSRSSGAATKSYSLKPWAFYKGELLAQTPDATRIQSGTYGDKDGDIVETNTLNQKVLLSPLISRNIEALVNKNRVFESGGGASGSQSWTFTILISHPNAADKYYTFNSCSVAAPTIVFEREPFNTSQNGNQTTTIIILKVNDKKIFSHPGEKTIDATEPNTNASNVPYLYSVHTPPKEGSAQCTPPEDKEEQGPGGLYATCDQEADGVRRYLEFYGQYYLFQNYKYLIPHPCGTPEPSKPTPPEEEDAYNPYDDRSVTHWHTLVMGNQKQIIAMQTKFAQSTGPNPNPLTAISENKTFLIATDNQEILIGGTKPEVFSPKDNLIKKEDSPEQKYYRVDDSPFFPPPSTPPPIPPISSVRSLLVDSYTIGTVSTKKSEKQTIFPIPNSAIIQNCSFHPE